MFVIEWQRSGLLKKVKRLNLLFDDEDAQAFRTRVQVRTPSQPPHTPRRFRSFRATCASACRRSACCGRVLPSAARMASDEASVFCLGQSAAAFRAHAEAELRYVSYVQRQPFVNDMALVGPAFKRRLLALAGEGRAASLPAVTQDYLDAAYDNYQYAVRKSIVDVQVTTTSS
jgi:hypothetical protein